jgi:hypothetical protein
MIETTLDIAHAGADTNCEVDSNAGGAAAQQAELVTFAHYLARVFLLLGPARAMEVVATLVESGEPAPQAVAAPARTTAIAKFVDGSSGPRLRFRLKTRGELYAGPSVDAVRRTLRGQRGDDRRFAECVARVEELMARLGATAQVHADNEFDLALAAADVAWRSVGDDGGEAPDVEPECRGCGYRGPKFEPRLWPSTRAILSRCGRCGAGVWMRAGHRARLIRPDIWAAMETMRSELADVSQASFEPDAPSTLLGELKRVFAENGWPYSEVAGAPLLLSELSGPAGSWDFYAQAVEEKDLVLLYSIAPQRVPEERRLDVSEFLTRANYGLADGNFELDFDDGEVRFKSVLHVPAELDGLLVKRVVRVNGTALETYLPTISELIDRALP